MKRIIEILQTGVLDDDGKALINGQVTFYEAGTTNLQTVFRNWELTEPHSNPAILDTAGMLTAYVDGRVKLVIANSTGTPLRVIDHVGNEDEDVAAAATAIAAGLGLSKGADNSLNVNVDSTTITIDDDALTVPDGGIGTTQIADSAVTTAKINANAVTRPKLASLGQQSNSSNSVEAISGSYTDLANTSITITTTGRPVLLILMPFGNGGANPSTFAAATSSGGTSSIFVEANLKFVRDSTALAEFRTGGQISIASGNFTFLSVKAPTSLVFVDDSATAGTHTYKVQVQGSPSSTINSYKFMAIEL